MKLVYGVLKVKEMLYLSYIEREKSLSVLAYDGSGWFKDVPINQVEYYVEKIYDNKFKIFLLLWKPSPMARVPYISFIFRFNSEFEKTNFIAEILEYHEPVVYNYGKVSFRTDGVIGINSYLKKEIIEIIQNYIQDIEKIIRTRIKLMML